MLTAQGCEKVIKPPYLADNQNKKWREGVRYLQFMTNRAYHSAVKRSPYEAMFDCLTKVGLFSSTTSKSVLNSINTEEDLEKLTLSHETAIIGLQSNLTQGNILLFTSFTKSIKKQEFIDSNVKPPYT